MAGGIWKNLQGVGLLLGKGVMGISDTVTKELGTVSCIG